MPGLSSSFDDAGVWDKVRCALLGVAVSVGVAVGATRCCCSCSCFFTAAVMSSLPGCFRFCMSIVLDSDLVGVCCK